MEVKSLVKEPDMVKVQEFLGDDEVIQLEIIVHEDDMGTVIGRGGKIGRVKAIGGKGHRTKAKKDKYDRRRYSCKKNLLANRLIVFDFIIVVVKLFHSISSFLKTLN